MIKLLQRNSRAYQTNNKHVRYILNGMNEGVADFFSSVVTKGNISGFTLVFQRMGRRTLPADFTSSRLSMNQVFMSGEQFWPQVFIN